jgi:hypothetical protein
MRTHHTNKQVAFKCKCVVYRKCASNVMTHNILYNLLWHILSWVEQFTWLHADLYGNISDFFQPSSIHQRLTHCSMFTQLLNPLVLSRHWALSSRILAHKNHYYYYYLDWFSEEISHNNQSTFLDTYINAWAKHATPP